MRSMVEGADTSAAAGLCPLPRSAGEEPGHAHRCATQLRSWHGRAGGEPAAFACERIGRRL